MDPAKGDIAELASCTSCRFKEDKSNYWTAVLYFKHRNGSFIRVPQIANEGTGAPNGGMTIYYIRPRPPAQNLSITIFPEVRLPDVCPSPRSSPLLYTPSRGPSLCMITSNRASACASAPPTLVATRTSPEQPASTKRRSDAGTGPASGQVPQV